MQLSKQDIEILKMLSGRNQSNPLPLNEISKRLNVNNDVAANRISNLMINKKLINWIPVDENIEDKTNYVLSPTGVNFLADFKDASKSNYLEEFRTHLLYPSITGIIGAIVGFIIGKFI